MLRLNKVNKLSLVIFLCVFLVLSCQPSEKMTVHMIGDSTMAEKSLNGTERGWGMLVSTFVDTARVQVRNYGKNGRSTKSFVDEGWWTMVLDSVKPGDFVLIQFGHNDEKTDTSLHTDPATTYRDYLIKFVTESRAKGATPILLTSIVRRSFDAKENLIDSHGDYPQAVRETAEQVDVSLIDLELKTRMLECIAGWEGSHGMYQFEPPKEIDNTHLCNFGAYAIARMVAEDIKEQNIPIPLSTNPDPLANANENTLDLSYDYFYDNIQSAQKTLLSLSSVSGYSDFLAALTTAKSNYDQHAFNSLEEINEAVQGLHRAELIYRWIQPAPFNATFAIGNASFEEGAGWNSAVGANIPLAWNIDATLKNGEMKTENTNASDGNYCYSIAADTGSSVDFYQEITLPAGEYVLTVDLKPHAGNAARLYAKTEGKIDTVTATGSGSSWATTSVKFSVPSDHRTTRLGITASVAIMIDNFKLIKEK